MNDYITVDGQPVELNGHCICPFCLEYFKTNNGIWGRHIKKCRNKSTTKGEVQRRYKYIKRVVKKE